MSYASRLQIVAVAVLIDLPCNGRRTFARILLPRAISQFPENIMKHSTNDAPGN